MERGVIHAADVHAITRQATIFVSPVNIAELQHGLALLNEGPRKEMAAKTLRRVLRKPRLPVTWQTGRTWGEIVAELQRENRQTHYRVNDLWLAAQCVQRDFTLLTANPKDFQDIPGLKFVALTPS